MYEGLFHCSAAKAHFVAHCRLPVGEIAESSTKVANRKLRCGIVLIWLTAGLGPSYQTCAFWSMA